MPQRSEKGRVAEHLAAAWGRFGGFQASHASHRRGDGCGVIDDDTPDKGNAAADTALDGADEGQACGLVFVGTPGNASSLVQVAGRISREGVAGCTCLDVDQNGTAEAVATFPPGGDCGRTAAMACLSGHAPPDRDCATIDFNSSNCPSQ